MSSKAVGNFSAFLEAMNKPQAEPPKGGVASPLQILAVLAATGPEGMSADELRRATGMAIGDFGRAIESFNSAGLISVEGAAGDEVVRLTDNGAQVAKVA